MVKIRNLGKGGCALVTEEGKAVSSPCKNISKQGEVYICFTDGGYFQFFDSNGKKVLDWDYFYCNKLPELNLVEIKLNYNSPVIFLDTSNLSIFSPQEYQKLKQIYSSPKKYLQLSASDFKNEAFSKNAYLVLRKRCTKIINNATTPEEKASAEAKVEKLLYVAKKYRESKLNPPINQ